MTGRDSKFDLQHLSQCGSMYNCLSGSVPVIQFACCWNAKQPQNNYRAQEKFVNIFSSMILLILLTVVELFS